MNSKQSVSRNSDSGGCYDDVIIRIIFENDRIIRTIRTMPERKFNFPKTCRAKKKRSDDNMNYSPII